MPPTILNKKSSNWVDRGDPPNAVIQRVLERFLGQPAISHSAWFQEQSDILVGMVAADATEVHVAGFLRTLLGPTSPAHDRDAVRGVAIAIWHIAKAALVRDFAERVLRGEIPVNEPTPDSLSHWLAARLLTPAQLLAFEQRSPSEEP